MVSVEHDLGYLRVLSGELKDYLLSDHLFWPLESGPFFMGMRYPSLTLGGLLLALARARAYALDPERGALLARLERQIEAVRTRWRAAWERKAAREFPSRLNQWRNYLAEYRDNPEAHADYYPQEVKIRAMLTLLQAEVDRPRAEDLELLRSLDHLLRAALTPGDFVWESGLSPGFPPESYWYLYGVLRGQRGS